MGEIYQKMERDLTLRNVAESTRVSYLRCCCKFVRHAGRSPAVMGSFEVDGFLESLVRRGKSPSTQRTHVAALKFLYGVTLERREVAEKIPWPKTARRIPDVLSGTEVATLLGVIAPLKYRLVLTTAYGAGLRISEACSLRVGDIDSKRGLIHVRLGKGAKDRFVMLSQRLLGMLREYWKLAQPRGPFLFPGEGPGSHVTEQAVRAALKAALPEAGIHKHVTPHLLRHSLATHLLEAGADISVIQVVLGHASIRTTAQYTQVSQQHVASVKSPLDLLGTAEGAVLG